MLHGHSVGRAFTIINTSMVVSCTDKLYSMNMRFHNYEEDTFIVMLALSELCQKFHSFATDTFTMDHSQSARSQRVTRSKERLGCTPLPPPLQITTTTKKTDESVYTFCRLHKSLHSQQQQERPTRVFTYFVVCTKVYTPETRFRSQLP